MSDSINKWGLHQMLEAALTACDNGKIDTTDDLAEMLRAIQESATDEEEVTGKNPKLRRWLKSAAC